MELEIFVTTGMYNDGDGVESMISFTIEDARQNIYRMIEADFKKTWADEIVQSRLLDIKAKHNLWINDMRAGDSIYIDGWRWQFQIDRHEVDPMQPVINTVEKPKPKAYLVSLESAGCLPDSQQPAYSFKDAIETARSMFGNERDGFGWTWAVHRVSKKQLMQDGSAVFASQNGNGLYSVVITVVDREVAEDWEDA